MSEALLHQILDTPAEQRTVITALEPRFEASELRNAERHVELMGHTGRVEANVDRFEIKVDRLRDDMSDVKLRLATLEQIVGQSNINVLVQNGRQDRLDTRIEIVEKRLDLYDPPNAV